MSGSVRIQDGDILFRDHTLNTVMKTNNTGLFVIDPAHDTITTGIHSNGFTGIGTAEPEAVLHTIPTGSINSGDLTQGGILIGDLGANFAMGIDQNEIFQTGNDLYIGTLYNTDDNYGKIRFRTDDGTSFSDRMVIQRNGNVSMNNNLTVVQFVGIGTTGPLSKLHIYDSVEDGQTELRISNGDVDDFPGSQDDGGAIIFDGAYKSDVPYSIDSAEYSKIIGAKENSSNYTDGYLAFYTNRDQDRSLGSSPLLEERMRIDSLGNVGIGTTNPGYKLEVEGSSRVDGKFVNGNDYQGNAAYGATFDSGSRYYQYRTADERYLTIYTTGTSQTTSIQAASNGAANNRLSINPNGGTVGINKGALLDPNATVSLDVNGSINYNGSINDVSDRRIKTNIHDLNDEEALEKIRNLQPKKYNYIDTEQKTSDTVYGFIAQEVKDIIPFSVSTKRDAIPSIMNTYGCSTTVSEDEETITISIPNTIENITVDDTLMVKIDTNEYNTYSFNVDVASISDSSVSVVVNASTIHTDIVEQVKHMNEVFIYGKFVDDFHILNKNAVFVVATAAIQELDRKVSNLTNENNNLKTQLSTIESRLTALENP